ncbi:MAG: hypothetical protein ABIG63_04660 [Chloroflexota bacterium]
MLTISDTHPEIGRIQIDWMRTAPAWKKADMLGQMYQTMKQLALAGLRHRYPNASNVELRRRLADLILGPELAEKVYGAMSFPEVSDAH